MLALLIILFRSKRRKESVLWFYGLVLWDSFRLLVVGIKPHDSAGDKWTKESDVKEWLNTPGNQPYLNVSSVIEAMGILHWIHSNLKFRTLQVMATFASLVANVSHRSAFDFFILLLSSVNVSVGIFFYCKRKLLTYLIFVTTGVLWKLALLICR